MMEEAIDKINQMIDASVALVKSVNVGGLRSVKTIRDAFAIERNTPVEVVRDLIDENLGSIFRTFQDGPRQVLKVCRETVVPETVESLINEYPGEYDIEDFAEILGNVVFEMEEPEIRTALIDLLDADKAFIFKNRKFEPWIDTPDERKVFELIARQNGLDVDDVQTALLGEDADKWTLDEMYAVEKAIGRLYAKGVITCECFNPVECTDFSGPVTLTRKGRRKLEVDEQ